MIKVLEPNDWYLIYSKTKTELNKDKYTSIAVLKAYDKKSAVAFYKAYYRKGNTLEFDEWFQELRAVNITIAEKEELLRANDQNNFLYERVLQIGDC